MATAALSALAALALLRLDYEAPPASARPGSRSLLRETADGVRTVVRHRDLRLIFGLGATQAFVRGALNVFTVVVAFELFDKGEPAVATLATAVGAGGVVGSLVVSPLVGSHHLGAWLSIALIAWGAPIALLGTAPAFTIALLLMAVVGVANAVIDTPLFTLPVRLVHDSVLARAFGVFEGMIALAVGLGSLVTPVVIDWLDLRGALVAIGLVLPAAGVLCWGRVHALDERLAVRDDEIRVLRHAPMLSELPIPSIEHLATRLRRVTLPPGGIMLEQGETGGGFFVILEGEAEIVGDDAILGTLGPGDSFGEIALLHDVPRTATIRARTRLIVFELEAEDFLGAVAVYRASSDAAYAVVAQRLANFRPAGITI